MAASAATSTATSAVASVATSKSSTNRTSTAGSLVLMQSRKILGVSGSAVVSGNSVRNLEIGYVKHFVP